MPHLDITSPTGRAAGIPAGDRRLCLHVIATTERGTRAALAAASTYAGDLDAAIVLLVPHVVPYAQPLEHPADSPDCAGERFRRVAILSRLDVTIRVCVCRSQTDTVAILPRDALVLVGSERWRWLRGREERLVEALRRRGFSALLVRAAVRQMR